MFFFRKMFIVTEYAALNQVWDKTSAAQVHVSSYVIFEVS